MKSITSFVKSIFAGMTIIAMSAAVQAAPISYTYESGKINKELITILGWGILPNQTTLGYDLTSGSWSNEGTPTSYDPAIDTLTSLNLTLNFSGPDLWSKLFRTWEGLSIETSIGDSFLVQSSSTAATVTFSGIDLAGYDLSEFGNDIMLTLTEAGRTVLTGYTLSFSGTRDLAQAVPVPTPSSLALLSVGLLSAGWFSRRRNETAHS